MSTPYPDKTITLFEDQPHELNLLYIPDGRFRMGSRGNRSVEEPRHWVEITEPFWLGETPATQAQYAELVKLSGADLDTFPSHFKPPQYRENLRRPVEQVSWDDCQTLLQHLQKTGAMKSQYPKGTHLCLPTEAQWEYACRACTDTDYYSGDGAAALAEVGWFYGNSEWETQPVADNRFKPNANGLYDMHGSVWEWCYDVWDENAYSKRGAITVDRIVSGALDAPRVLRGSSWFNIAEDCRSAFRVGDHPSVRFRRDGFRLCLFSGPVKNEQASGGAGAPGPQSDLSRLNTPPR